jgi:sugar (pentulose or hexulose) kinase
MAYLLGCDVGTGGAKSVVIDEKGTVLGSHFVEYPLHTPRPGIAEQDPEMLWRAGADSVRLAVDKAGVAPRDVVALGLSAQSPGCVLIDAHRQALRPAHIWMDRRATEQCHWISENIGEEAIFAVTGNNVIDPYFAMTKLMWERDNEPDLYRRAIKSLNQKDFIMLRLTGEMVTDPCNAALIGMAYDARQNDWNTDMLQRLGVERSKLPDIRGYEAVVGRITPEAAEQTGLLEGTPVINGTADGPAAWLSMGCLDPGDCVLTLGSSATWAVVHRQQVFPPGLLSIGNVADPDTYLTFAATSSAGALLRWFRDEFGVMEIAQGAERGHDPYDLLTAQAEQMPPGSDGLIILPYFMGERMPIWDCDARGVMFGLSLNHNRGHVIRALMEGVGYSVYHNIKLAQDHGLTIRSPMGMVEGGARSPLWRQIVSDICNVDTVFMAGAQGAPFGDAVIAGVAMGVFDDYRIIKDCLQYSDHTRPDTGRHALYTEMFDLYLDLYESQRANFAKLKQIYTSSLPQA